MSTTALLTLTAALSLGQLPYGGAYTPYGGAAAGYGAAAGGATYGGGGGGAGGVRFGAEELYQFDAYDNWVHGHFQEMPAYGGFHLFRPYNYKHLLSQSQVAGGWGMSPTMPYSQEYFRRAREHAMQDMRQAPANVSRPELARVRDPRELQQTAQTASELPRQGYGDNTQPAGANLPPGRFIDPAVHVQPRPSRVEELQERIRQQSLQLRALEDALHEEYRSSPVTP